MIKPKKKSDGRLHMRANENDKSAWLNQAKKENLKLSEWVTKTLNNKINQ